MKLHKPLWEALVGCLERSRHKSLPSPLCRPHVFPADPIHGLMDDYVRRSPKQPTIFTAFMRSAVRTALNRLRDSTDAWHGAPLRVHESRLASPCECSLQGGTTSVASSCVPARRLDSALGSCSSRQPAAAQLRSRHLACNALVEASVSKLAQR